MDYNWLLFRIKNANLPIKKIHSSSGKVENNFINDFSVLLKYELYFQKIHSSLGGVIITEIL